MSNEAIIEIRAGVGGDEAALFASDLFNMYKRYAMNKGWGVEVIDYNQNSLGGYKSIVFELKGADVFDKMKYAVGYGFCLTGSCSGKDKQGPFYCFYRFSLSRI